MENLYYYDLSREVPESAKKKITGGRINGMTDINPMWRIKKLTEMFGPCGIGWYYKSVNEWMETYEKEVAAFVKIELYIKIDGEWSKPIQGTGGSKFVEMQRSGAYVSDECYKMATTDAISVACKQLGIGADVYWDKDETKYRNGQNQDGRKPAKNEQAKADDETIQLRESLSRELIRTGYSWDSVIKKYKTETAEQLSKLQLKDCITKMRQLSDKESSE